MSLSSKYPTIRPSLLLDFANSKVLDPRITFSRASTGTYYDEDGILQTAQNNVARFTFDPVTEKSLGLLIEEQRTNLLKYSSDYSVATWTKRAGTGVLGAQTIAPDGTLTGFSIFDSASSTGTYIRQAATGWPDNTIVTVSVYVKKQQLSTIRLTSFAKDSVSNTIQTTINFDTGAITSGTTGTIANASGGGVYVGNGWWRIYTTFNSSAGAVDIPINLGTAGISPVGDGTSSFYAWGAQLEAGAFSTSYIATVASQVTRTADFASMTGTNFSSWFNNAEGSVYVDYTYGQKLASIRLASFTDGSTNGYFEVVAAAGLVPTVSNGSYWFGLIGGVSTITTVGSAITNVANQRRVFAGAYKVNDFASCNNGGAIGTDTDSGVPVVDRLYFNNYINSSSTLLCGTIAKFAYYPVRLPDNQLQALTGS